ncbi:Mannonate dehydratase [Paenibacillus konkukensis]|uniref:mannonate dehydratase n=1 Tax=Paenibacillus konkukensis TaxID=2020716 RepID=A0ABY4RJU1_9BACL|nr:mannonate dehydratase [Paenibacillus konkukensis]UQZ82398.1 Mannonate dehydratase [Paenibacillus konkukensis]
MKLGLGLVRHMLNKDNFRFARQAGCTHIVAHLADYNNMYELPGTTAEEYYGKDRSKEYIWSYEGLLELRSMVEAEGLILHAIENFDPLDWYDVLLDGPCKSEQLQHLKQIVYNAGRAGIPVIGYNFSVAGVWGRIQERAARGGALTHSYAEADAYSGNPLPHGQIWNVTYDQALAERGPVHVSAEQLWERLAYFLREIVPAAEQAGVVMAAHPDDPPMPTLRGTARLVYQPDLYQKLLDLVPSASNRLEFCMGTIQEMTESSVYEAIERYSSQNKIGYVHCRNVRGKVPHYSEVFIDEGDIDILRALRLFKQTGYDGVFVPDHTPLMSCGAPWHSGMAYALGHIGALLHIVNNEAASA